MWIKNCDIECKGLTSKYMDQNEHRKGSFFSGSHTEAAIGQGLRSVCCEDHWCYREAGLCGSKFRVRKKQRSTSH